MKEIKNIIYGLYEPKELGSHLRYVGQSAQGLARAYEHFKPGLLKAKSHKINWINSLLTKGLKPEVGIIRDLGQFDNNEVRDAALNDAEIELIAHYRALGVNLTNSTDGGEGTRGNVLSEESKKLISDKRIEWYKNNEIPSHLYETCYKRKDHKIIEGIESKHCSDCDTFRSLTEFFKDKNRWDGLNPICKPCDMSRKTELREKNWISDEDWNKSYESRTPKMANSIKERYANDPEYKKKISKATSKPVIATSVLNPNEVLEFESALAAKKLKGFTNNSISKACKTGVQYKGYYWKFKEKK